MIRDAVVWWNSATPEARRYLLFFVPGFALVVTVLTAWSGWAVGGPASVALTALVVHEVGQ